MYQLFQYTSICSLFKWIYLPLGGDEMFDWSNDIKDGVLDNTSLDCVDSTSTSPGEHF